MSTLQILKTKADPATVIHPKISRKDMMRVYGPTFGELMTAFAKQGGEPDVSN